MLPIDARVMLQETSSTTKNTSTRTPGQPASQRHSTSPSRFRALGAGEYRLSREMPDRSPVTPQSLQIRRHLGEKPASRKLTDYPNLPPFRSVPWSG